MKNMHRLLNRNTKFYLHTFHQPIFFREEEEEEVEIYY